MNVILTGATGMVGSNLAFRLIRRGDQIGLVGRGPEFESRARQRIGTWGKIPSWRQVRFLDWESNRQPTTEPSPGHLIHAAADTNLSPRASAGQIATNLHLLNKAFDLCRLWRIPRIDFLSTAYVCGIHPGLVRESRHSPHPEFRNPYEESKWRCEESLIDLDSPFPRVRVVHRPSLILPPVSHAHGNSPRAFVRLFEKLRFLASRNRGNSFSVSIPNDARIGFVSLNAFGEDFLDMLDRDFRSGSHLFHYSSRQVPAFRAWVDWICEAIPGLHISFRETCPNGRRILGELEPYLRGNFIFDQSNLGAMLGRTPSSQIPLREDFFRALILRLLGPVGPFPKESIECGK